MQIFKFKKPNPFESSVSSQSQVSSRVFYQSSKSRVQLVWLNSCDSSLSSLPFTSCSQFASWSLTGVPAETSRDAWSCSRDPCRGPRRSRPGELRRRDGSRKWRGATWWQRPARPSRNLANRSPTSNQRAARRSGPAPSDRRELSPLMKVLNPFE